MNVPREREIIREILSSWELGLQTIKDTWREHCAPDVIWWNSARGEIVGVDACLAAFDAMDQMVGYTSLAAPVINLLARDGLVFVERTDGLKRADGSLIVSIPVTGVIEFANDKIISWRDCCDDWMRDHRPDDAPRRVVA
jgi:limonene-1,2-epoxide hydrolase